MRTSGPSSCSRAPADAASYDNMKTAVETVFVGKDRLYNRRFLQMCSHYLIEPVGLHAPASGWERVKSTTRWGSCASASSRRDDNFKTYAEMNAWLLDKCIALTPGAPPSRADRADDLGGVRGGAAEARSLCGPVRRLPRSAGVGLEDLPGALRQQQILGSRKCCWPSR